MEKQLEQLKPEGSGERPDLESKIDKAAPVSDQAYESIPAQTSDSQQLQSELPDNLQYSNQLLIRHTYSI